MLCNIQEIYKKSIYKIAANFHISGINELYFDDEDPNGLFFWLEGVEYING